MPVATNRINLAAYQALFQSEVSTLVPLNIRLLGVSVRHRNSIPRAAGRRQLTRPLRGLHAILGTLASLLLDCLVCPQP